MTTHAHHEPLPANPHFDLDGDFELEDILDDEEEIDLTDLFERPASKRVILPQ